MEFGEQGIVENIDVLRADTETYRPSDLPEREEELAELKSLLHPVSVGGTAQNCLIWGPPGQGKTVGIELKTQELMEWAEESNNDTNIEVVHLRCKGCNNSYNVLTMLVKELREINRGPGEDRPAGLTQKELVEETFEELRKIGGAVIIVLDEIDSIGDDDYVLYELSRANIEEVKLSVMGVTNDLQFMGTLDSDVKSSLGKREIHFTSYNAEDLKNILARRAVGAFRDTHFDNGVEDYQHLNSDVLESGTIQLCAALSAQDTGDARQAIELLLVATEIAQKEQASMVTEDHVRLAQDKLERESIENGISSQTPQRKLALLTVLKSSKDDDTPIETKDLYQQYTKWCTLIDEDARALDTFRDKLNELSHMNILSKNRRGRGQGKGVTNKYDLAVPEDVVVSSLTTEQEKGTIKDIVEIVQSATL